MFFSFLLASLCMSVSAFIHVSANGAIPIFKKWDIYVNKKVAFHILLLFRRQLIVKKQKI